LRKVRVGSAIVTQPNNIDARTLREMLERGERVTLVDVRRREQHAEGAIPGSVNFDAYDALHAGDERAMKGLELPEGERVVTYCNRGTSGAVAAEQLRRRGYEAHSLEGGLEAWKDLQRARA
jgi:rhodanese-related sulfurtransferase